MPFSLIQRLQDTPVAVIDTETTGASAMLGHRVIEVGVVRYEAGQPVARYEQLIDPQRPISAGVTALTGISRAMVEGMPTFEQQIPALMEVTRGAVIVGHNVRFDLSFLAREFRRGGLDLKSAWDNAPVLDTVRIARKRFGRGGNALQLLCRRFDIYPTVAHRALADADTTGQLLEHLLEPVGGWSLCLCDAMAQQGGPMALTPTSPQENILPLELEEALDRRRPVCMDYVDARGARTQRVIQPLHVMRRSGELLLVAHCQLRHEQRTFKLDRIVQLTRLADPDTAMPPTVEPLPPTPTITPPHEDPPTDSTGQALGPDRRAN